MTYVPYETKEGKFTEGRAMEIISNIALITINETMVVQLISFLIFVFLLNRVMIRPLLGTMDDRENFISNLQQDTEDMEIEIQNLTKKMNSQEDAIRAEAMALMKAAEDSGKQHASEIFALINQEISELKQKTQEDVNLQIEEARKHLSKESEILATSIMEKILDRRIAS